MGTIHMMTDLDLRKIRSLNELGYNDSEIAEHLGCSNTSVHYWRRKLDLPPVRLHRRESLTQYTIYEKKTSAYLCEGTASECAEFLGIKKSSLARIKVRFEHGESSRYEIYEVTDEEREVVGDM